MRRIYKDHSDCQCKGYFPIALKSVHFAKEKYRDLLIQISLLCRETDITMFVNSLDDLNELFVKINPKLNMFFESAFTDTKYCKQLDTLESDQIDELVVVPSSNSYINANELIKLMQNQKHENK